MSGSCTSAPPRPRTSAKAATCLALLISLTTGVAGAASARTAPVTTARSLTATIVTIKAEGVDLSGRVTSTRTACVADREVLVFQQIGTRGGGDDVRRFHDLASADGSWDTGNTGVAGRFYAKVKATTSCGADTSPTIRASR